MPNIHPCARRAAGVRCVRPQRPRSRILHAPAPSLAAAFAALRQGAARNRIAAGANHVGARRYSPAPSGLPRDPTLSGAPRAPHALPPRPAADRFALLRGLRLGRSAIVARRRSSSRASACRAALRAALRPRLRPSSYVPASAPGGRAPCASLRSRAPGRAPPALLPCVPRPARAAFSPPPLPGRSLRSLLLAAPPAPTTYPRFGIYPVLSVKRSCTKI